MASLDSLAPTPSPSLPELRQAVEALWVAGTHRPGRKLLAAVRAWAAAEQDAEEAERRLRSLERLAVREGRSAHFEVLREALRHLPDKALSTTYFQYVLRKAPHLLGGLGSNPHLSDSQRLTLLCHLRERLWRQITAADYLEVAQTLFVVASLAERKEDAQTSAIRSELVNYAVHGSRSGRRQPNANVGMQRTLAGALFAFPNLSAEAQQELFDRILPRDRTLADQALFLHQAASSEHTLPEILKRIARGTEGDATGLLSSLLRNPRARAIPEVYQALVEKGDDWMLRQLLGRARGEEFRRIFVRLARIQPAEAVAALSLPRSCELQPEDLLPLLASENPYIRLAAIRRHGEELPRNVASPRKRSGR